jgi:hypothetical protein
VLIIRGNLKQKLRISVDNICGIADPVKKDISAGSVAGILEK